METIRKNRKFNNKNINIDYANRKPKAIHYNDYVRFRVSNEEKEALTEKAKKLNLTVGDLIRNALVKTYEVDLYIKQSK